MRIKDSLFLHRIGDECIVMQDGSSNIDLSNILNLNATAEYLWTQIADGEFNADKIVRLLTDRYEVTEEQARRDAESFISKLREADVIYE